MAKRNKKEVAKISDQLYNKHCMGVQFDIFDLDKVTAESESILANGGSIEDAEQAMIRNRDELRLNQPDTRSIELLGQTTATREWKS